MTRDTWVALHRSQGHHPYPAPTRENPWPGLEAFEKNARAYFFGRDQEAASLWDHVLDAPGHGLIRAIRPS